MILTVALLSFALSFCILFVARMYLAKDKLPTADAFFHLLIIKSICEHRWKFPSSLQNVIFDYGIKPYSYLAYPPLFHYIVALFPTEFYQEIAKIFNLTILSILSSITAVFTYGITSNFVLAIFASFIATFNLSIFESIVEFNSRALGLLFYSLIIYVVVLCPENLFSVLAIAFFIMLINLTHKFATQAIIFGLLPYILIFGKFHFLASVALGFLLSILVSGGFYLKILKEHYYWFYFYSFYPDKTRITSKLIKILARNIWYLLIIASVVYFYIFKNESILHNDLMARIIFWAFTPILIALLVSIPRLSFLGEERRYVQYGVVPVGIVSALYLESPHIHIWLILLICSSMSLFELLRFKSYLQHSNSLVHPDDISSYHSLRSYGLSNLLVFPNVRTLEVNYFTDLKVVHLVRQKPSWTSEHLENLLNKYGVQFVLKFKGCTSPIFEKLKDIVKITKIAVFKNFEIYRLTSKTNVR